MSLPSIEISFLFSFSLAPSFFFAVFLVFGGGFPGSRSSLGLVLRSKMSKYALTGIDENASEEVHAYDGGEISDDGNRVVAVQVKAAHPTSPPQRNYRESNLGSRAPSLQDVMARTPSKAGVMLNLKHAKSVNLFQGYSQDVNNPVGWLYSSFTHPVYGKRNYHVAEHAALRIQARFRGRKGRDEFLRMYADKNALYYMLIYIFYYCLICWSIDFKKTGQDGFLMSELLRDYIVEEEFIDDHTHILKTFHDVASEEEFWQYMTGPLASNMFPDDCYAESVYNASHSCVGTVYTNNLFVGGMRVLTHRAKKGTLCRTPSAMQSLFDDIGCYLPWDDSTAESTFDYLRGLDKDGVRVEGVRPRSLAQILIAEQNNVTQCFSTEKRDSLTLSTLQGQSGWTMDRSYATEDAYVCEFLYTEGSQFKTQIEALRDSGWIDAATRAITVEMTFINPSVGMSTSVRLFFEFQASGGVIPQFTFMTAWLAHLYPPHLKLVQWVVFALLFLFTMGYLMEEISEAREKGCAYFSDVVNVADIFNYSFGKSASSLNYLLVHD